MHISLTSTRNTSTYTLEPKTSYLAMCAVSAVNFIIVISAVVTSASRNLRIVAPPLT